MRRTLLIFVDGVGIGEDDPRFNPVAAARLPRLRGLLGGAAPVRGAFASGPLRGDGALAVAVDAGLGVAGRPQSGTGQTALLSGRNAPALFGRHFGAWVPTPLRDTLARHSVFAAATRAGRRVVFANAAPPPPRDPVRRPPAFPFAAHMAGVPHRGLAALLRGDAVPGSLGGAPRRWPGGGLLPRAAPPELGGRLARIAAGAELTVWAHYDTDAAGHGGALAPGVAALERLDAFLGGVLDALPADVLLLLTSDHGNLEDVRQGHTLHPVPLLAAGPGRERFAAEVRALTDIAPAVCAHLGVPFELPDPAGIHPLASP
jgi:hypothetical protein